MQKLQTNKVYVQKLKSTLLVYTHVNMILKKKQKFKKETVDKYTVNNKRNRNR